jgi:superfamily II DNA or RNA helicase
MHHSNDEEKEKILEYMLFQRANIEKSADNKYDELDSILDEIGDDKIEDTIIFVSPEQIDRVLAILDRRNIPSHRFSEKESNTPSEKYNNLSERQHLIQLFKSKKLKVLVAIKCLDEGIDIPSARRAIVMASSTNPREYIQRVGRVIRQSEDKKFAEIYDMIIRPNTSAGFSKEFKELEKRIFSKELVRVTELSENALNNVSVLRVIKKIEGELK